MNTKNPSGSDIPTAFKDFFSEPATRYTLIVSLSIAAVMFLEQIYPMVPKALTLIGHPWLEANYPQFIAADDRVFSQSFIEWFGTFYGFFLPLLLIRAWEQLDTADREFDREADSIKVLVEDVMLLNNEFLSFKKQMLNGLQSYVQHVLDYYPVEHLDQQGDLKALPGVGTVMHPKKQGDTLLQKLRSGYQTLIYQGGGKRSKQLEPVTTELLERLNDAIDIRGDRISIFGERLFQSLRYVAIITSIIWLIPFYFLPLKLGVLGGLFKLVVTFLIIFILSVIDDLDDPFTGVWTLNTTTWKEVREEIDSVLLQLPDESSSETKEKKVKDRTHDENENGDKKPLNERSRKSARSRNSKKQADVS